MMPVAFRQAGAQRDVWRRAFVRPGVNVRGRPPAKSAWRRSLARFEGSRTFPLFPMMRRFLFLIFTLPAMGTLMAQQAPPARYIDDEKLMRSLEKSMLKV